MNEVAPPAPVSLSQSVLPVAETPEQPLSNRQPAREGSRPAQPEQTPTNTVSGHTDPAVRLSETIALLQPGARLEVQVSGANPEGQPLIRTDSGFFFVDGGQDLERSIQYLIEIVSVGTEIRAVFVAANDAALTDQPLVVLRPALRTQSGEISAYRPSPTVRPPAAGTPIGPGPPPPPLIRTGNRLNTVLLTRQNEPGVLPSPVIAGSALVVRVLSVTAPLSRIGPASAVNRRQTAQGIQGQNALRAANPAPDRLTELPPVPRTPLQRALAVARLFQGDRPTPSSTGIAPGRASAGSTPPPPGHPLATAATVATGLRGAPVAAAKSGVAPGMPGSLITGITVISAQDATTRNPTNPSGSTNNIGGERSATRGTSQLVRTPIGLLRLNASEGLPIGSTIALEVISTRGPEEIRPREATPPLLNLAATWPTLDEVMETLAATDPALAAQTAQRALPAPTPKLGPTLLFFMTALNLGDAQSWLGQAATTALEKAGRHDLLRRLRSEFSRIRRAADDPKSREPGSVEWRPTVFPFLDGGSVRLLTLFTRQGNQHDDDGDLPPDSRFVLDLDLSALGPVQFDGLVRKSRFDLIVRSKKPFPERMRDDIRGLFRGAVAPTRLDGSVQFQTTKRFPVSPKGDYLRARGRAADSVVV